MNMKLLYTTSIDVPSTRANRLQIMSMAKEFSRILGKDFLLGLRAIDAEYMPEVSCVEMGSTRSFILAWQYLAIAKDGFTHIYCREEKLLFFMVLYNQLWFRLPLTFCYEIHHLIYVERWWHAFILRHVTRVVSITRGMTDAIVSVGYPETQIITAPDAVDVAMFDTSVGKAEARTVLGLPSDKRIVLYTGTIDEPWKGVGVLYKAMRELDDEFLCVIVGGKPHYVAYFNAEHPPRPNVLLVGHKPHEDIPTYLKAADILVLPNSAKTETSRVSTSPMKLFEYMASDRPIVASELPSILEILNDHNAYLVVPDDAEDLAKGIRTLTENAELGAMLSAQARKDVAASTWSARAAQILSFIS